MSNEVVYYVKNSFELKSQGHFKPAVEMLYKALAIEPENLEILVQLAHLYKLMENLEKCFYYAEKVLEIDKNHLECLALIKDIYVYQKNFEEALCIADKIFATKPSSENLAEKIKLLNILNKADKIEELEKELKDHDDKILFELANFHFNNKNPEKAFEFATSGYIKNPKNIYILMLLGKICFKKNDFQNAQKYFEEYAKKEKTPEVLNYLGLLKLNSADYQKSAEYFSKAFCMDDKNGEYAYNLASANFLRGWFDEASKYFTLAVSLSPERLDYHYSLAYLHYQKKDYDKSLIEINYILAKEKFPIAEALKAMIKAKSGDIIEAKNDLENILKNNEKDDFALSALGKIYTELNNFDAAKKSLESALLIKPESLDYLSDLAEIEFKNKNFDKALELSNKILEKNEKYVQAYILLAKIYFEKNDFEKVFDAAQEIIELDSNSPEGYYYNALSLFEQGDTNFAVESLKKSISLDLNNPALYIKMSEFYQDLGDFKEAYAWAKEACDIDEISYQNKWLCAKLAALLKDEKSAVNFYSHSYRLAPFDKDLVKEYSQYLKSVGKEKQAKALLK